MRAVGLAQCAAVPKPLVVALAEEAARFIAG
jgi:hypothetical protein